MALPGLWLAQKIDVQVFTQALIALPALLVGTWAGAVPSPGWARADTGWPPSACWVSPPP